MKLAEHSVRKMTPAAQNGTPDGEECGLIFCRIEEGLARVREEVPIGTLFLVADEEGFSFFSPYAGAPRMFNMVTDGADALPLFSAPDGVTCICAAGGTNLLRCARYFAEINRIPCYLFPAFASCDGAEEESGEVCVGSTKSEFPLAPARVMCDISAVKGVSAAYARILISRLALFEQRVLRAFCGAETGDLYERAYVAALSVNEESTLKELISANAALRRLEGRGMYAGEGIALARMLEKDGADNPEWQAYMQLSALYAAFFKRGEPRRYFVPDYALRALRAGEGESGYLRAKIPTPNEYAFRAIALEKMRALFLHELEALLGKREAQARKFRLLNGGGTERMENVLYRLRYLPEYEPKGFCAVIRDFGLMEWQYGEESISADNKITN